MPANDLPTLDQYVCRKTHRKLEGTHNRNTVMFCKNDSSLLICTEDVEEIRPVSAVSSDVHLRTVTGPYSHSPCSSSASPHQPRVSLRDVRRRQGLLARKDLKDTKIKTNTSKESSASKQEVAQTIEIKENGAGLTQVMKKVKKRDKKAKKYLKEDTSISEVFYSDNVVMENKRKKTKKRRVKDRGTNDISTIDVVRLESLSMDEDQPSAEQGSQLSTPLKSKRRQKLRTPKQKKKPKLSDDDVIVVAAVDSPKTTLREERLARLHAMSTEDDISNLKQSKATVVLSQAEQFPRIGHITQLLQTEEECECRLKLLPATAFEDPVCRTTALGLNIARDDGMFQTKQKRGKLKAARVKKELKNLQSVLPHYPVEVVYDILDSRMTDEGRDQLWTVKYSPSTLSQLLVRKGCVEIINEWLLSWKQDILKGQSGSRKQSKKKSSKKRNQFLDSDSGDECFEDEWTQTPILVITGSTGLGKTTCAYTIATILGYKVFEMNPSHLRSTRTVMDRVHESTKSQQVQKGKGISMDTMFDRIAQDVEIKPVRGIASFFTRIPKPGDVKKNRKKSNSTSAEESNTSSNAPEKTSQTANDLPQDQDGELNGADAVSLSKLSLILFDEADVAFEEDKGFYETITALGLEAKKPIILTCQSSGFLQSIGVEHTCVEITPHIDLEIAIYLCIISLVENEVADVPAMLQLVNKFNCDIRKCILHLQYLITSGGLQSPFSKQEKKDKRKSSAASSTLQQLAKMCCHQSNLDIIATHHHRLLIRGSQSMCHLSSNPSKVFIDTGVVTRQSADPVLWSSVSTMKSVYTDLLKRRFNLPKTKKISSSEMIPANIMISIREELPPYIAPMTDQELSLDFLPFIKAICQSESNRKASKTTRRFLHYLSRQGLYLSESDQRCILSVFSSCPRTDNTNLSQGTNHS
ncbi:uncharacterized protein [Watersipora subatra]|uniref:uncharacterized protein n=1 Tax=Watersipora subatra TaxID=2589382 RepID=UPI00355BA2B9